VVQANGEMHCESVQGETLPSVARRTVGLLCPAANKLRCPWFERSIGHRESSLCRGVAKPGPALEHLSNDVIHSANDRGASPEPRIETLPQAQSLGPLVACDAAAAIDQTPYVKHSFPDIDTLNSPSPATELLLCPGRPRIAHCYHHISAHPSFDDPWTHCIFAKSK
jgi:hypothetical protein